MSIANERQVQYLKTTSRWIYYTSTLFILLTAFDLYYRDKAIINLAAKRHQSIHYFSPVYPWLLVLLNMTSVIFICCHFTYGNKTIVLLAVLTLICTLIYRKLNAVDFDWMYNTPNCVAVISGLTWIFSDQILKEKRGTQKSQNADSSNSTVTSNFSPLDSAEKSASQVTGFS